MTAFQDHVASDCSSDESYDSDEAAPLKPDLDQLMCRVSQFVNRELSSFRRLTRGRYHEIYILYASAPRWSCIARLSRSPESVSKLLSEVATMKYVQTHTQIPVPEVYCYDFSTTNSVGVQFIAMERILGRHLYQMWDHLTIDHKKVVLSQIVRVLGQLAQLTFTEIGSLNDESKVGPLLHRDQRVDEYNFTTSTSGPFASTMEYLSSFINKETFRHGDSISQEAISLLSDVRKVLQEYCDKHGHSSTIRPPFRLRHADFDGQNMLFTDPRVTNGDAPRLVGVIDWEYAHSAPLYFLYEYPIFIQDSDSYRSDYSTNAILRRHFVRELLSQFPPGSEAYTEAKETMVAKCSTLNTFQADFTLCWMEWTLMKGSVVGYLQDEQNGTGRPYCGRADWVAYPDFDLEEDDLP